MRGLFPLFDSDNWSMARKVVSHKKHVDGLEAPRNSLELRIENSQTYYTARELPVEEDWSGKNSYPFEASMKKLINEEISKSSSTRKNAPSIVARLMGMDMMTSDSRSSIQPIEKKNENMRIRFSNKEANGRGGSIGHISCDSSSSRQMKLDMCYQNGDGDSGIWSKGQKSGKPTSREHPQEEELQKFKKEFEAWQAARFRDCSRFAELGNTSSQFLAQEDLNKAKSEIYAKPGRTMSEKSTKSKCHTAKAETLDLDNLQHHGNHIEPFQLEERKSFASKSRTPSRDFEQSVVNTTLNVHSFSTPTKIVILKPGADRLCNDQKESWLNSPCTLEQRGSIEDFLEEVRERLKCEMQGKMLKRGSVARGSGIETPYCEKISDPKQIAQTIAKQARENASRDVGTNLFRSESTRSYRSEVKFDGPSSPEFISRDTRRFVSERLKNVLKRETSTRTALGGHLRSYSVLDLDSESIRENQGRDNSKDRNEVSNFKVIKDEQKMQTRSFRCGLGEDRVVPRELSPRNLVRSLSAPVPGTSFGKLLLEDRHILTGAQIRRKLEATDNAFEDIQKQKKEKFNFKEKISNFKYSFSLRGRLFGKKIPSVMESHVSEHYPLKDLMSGPTVVSNFGERHENFTEVPPSPASVCSSSQEELWRPVDHLSPLSTPDVTPCNEYALPRVFREISSNLTELRRQLNQLESDEPPEEEMIQPKPRQLELPELKDPAEAFVRDLLVASGLYDRSSSDKFLLKCETLSRPISVSVFEEVEERYKKSAKDRETSMKDHKLLHDLLNETLSTVLGQPSSATPTLCKFRRNLIGCPSSSFQALQGKELLHCVWEIIRQHLQSPSDQSVNLVDDLVARDLRLRRWSRATDDIVTSLGREIESLIMGDLVEEILVDVKAMNSSQVF